MHPLAAETISKSAIFEDRVQRLHRVPAGCSINTKQTLTIAALRDAPLVALSHFFFSLCSLRWEPLSSSPA